MEGREIRLWNIFGATGGNHAGWIYSFKGICPTINTGGGGYRQPMIIEVKIDNSEG